MYEREGDILALEGMQEKSMNVVLKKKRERNQCRSKDTLLLKVSQPLCMLPDFGSGPTCPELHNKIIKRNGEKQQIPLITFPPSSCIAATVCGWRLLEMQMLE